MGRWGQTGPMIRASTLLALALATGLAACAPIDIPAPPIGPTAASGADDGAASRQEVEKRERRLARKRDKACEKHPERC